MHYHVITYDADYNLTYGNVTTDEATESIQNYLGLARMLYHGKMEIDFAQVESDMYEMAEIPGEAISCGVHNQGFMLWWVACPGCKNALNN